MFEADIEEELYEEQHPKWYLRGRNPPVYLWAQHFSLPLKNRNPLFTKIFLKEISIKKVYYPFLEETQILGMTYETFGIPSICGKVSKQFLKDFGKSPKKRCRMRKKDPSPKKSPFGYEPQIFVTTKKQHIFDDIEDHQMDYSPYISKPRQTTPCKRHYPEEETFQRAQNKLLNQFLVFEDMLDVQNASVKRKTYSVEKNVESANGKMNLMNKVQSRLCETKSLNHKFEDNQVNKTLEMVNIYKKSSLRLNSSDKNNLIKKRVHFSNVDEYRSIDNYLNNNESDDELALPLRFCEESIQSSSRSKNYKEAEKPVSITNVPKTYVGSYCQSMKAKNTTVVHAMVHRADEDDDDDGKRIPVGILKHNISKGNVSNSVSFNNLDSIDEFNGGGYDTDYEDASTQSISDGENYEHFSDFGIVNSVIKAKEVLVTDTTKKNVTKTSENNELLESIDTYKNIIDPCNNFNIKQTGDFVKISKIVENCNKIISDDNKNCTVPNMIDLDKLSSNVDETERIVNFKEIEPSVSQNKSQIKDCHKELDQLFTPDENMKTTLNTDFSSYTGIMINQNIEDTILSSSIQNDSQTRDGHKKTNRLFTPEKNTEAVLNLDSFSENTTPEIFCSNNSIDDSALRKIQSFLAVNEKIDSNICDVLSSTEERGCIERRTSIVSFIDNADPEPKVPTDPEPEAPTDKNILETEVHTNEGDPKPEVPTDKPFPEPDKADLKPEIPTDKTDLQPVSSSDKAIPETEIVVDKPNPEPEIHDDKIDEEHEGYIDSFDFDSSYDEIKTSQPIFSPKNFGIKGSKPVHLMAQPSKPSESQRKLCENFIDSTPKKKSFDNNFLFSVNTRFFYSDKENKNPKETNVTPPKANVRRTLNFDDYSDTSMHSVDGKLLQSKIISDHSVNSDISFTNDLLELSDGESVTEILGSKTGTQKKNVKTVKEVNYIDKEQSIIVGHHKSNSAELTLTQVAIVKENQGKNSSDTDLTSLSQAQVESKIKETENVNISFKEKLKVLVNKNLSIATCTTIEMGDSSPQLSVSTEKNPEENYVILPNKRLRIDAENSELNECSDKRIEATFDKNVKSVGDVAKLQVNLLESHQVDESVCKMSGDIRNENSHDSNILSSPTLSLHGASQKDVFLPLPLPSYDELMHQSSFTELPICELSPKSDGRNSSVYKDATLKNNKNSGGSSDDVVLPSQASNIIQTGVNISLESKQFNLDKKVISANNSINEPSLNKAENDDTSNLFSIDKNKFFHPVSKSIDSKTSEPRIDSKSGSSTVTGKKVSVCKKMLLSKDSDVLLKSDTESDKLSLKSRKVFSKEETICESNSNEFVTLSDSLEKRKKETIVGNDELNAVSQIESNGNSLKMSNTLRIELVDRPLEDTSRFFKITDEILSKESSDVETGSENGEREDSGNETHVSVNIIEKNISLEEIGKHDSNSQPANKERSNLNEDRVCNTFMRSSKHQKTISNELLEKVFLEDSTYYNQTNTNRSDSNEHRNVFNDEEIVFGSEKLLNRDSFIEENKAVDVIRVKEAIIDTVSDENQQSEISDDDSLSNVEDCIICEDSFSNKNKVRDTKEKCNIYDVNKQQNSQSNIKNVSALAKEAIIDPSDISTSVVNKKSKNRSLLDISLNKSDTAIGDKLSFNEKNERIKLKKQDNTNSTDLTTNKVISSKRSLKSDSYENDTLLSQNFSFRSDRNDSHVDSKSRGLSKIDPSVSTKCISLNEINSTNQWSKEAIIDPSDISTSDVNKKSKNRSLLDISLNKSDTAIGDKLSLNEKNERIKLKKQDNTNSTDLTTDKVISNKKLSKSDSYENDTLLSQNFSFRSDRNDSHVDSKSRGLSKIDPSVSTKCISLNEINSTNQWSKEAIIDPSDISTSDVNKKSKNRSLLDISLNKSDTAIGDKLSLNEKNERIKLKKQDNTNSTDLTSGKVISNKKLSKSDSYENDTLLSQNFSFRSDSNDSHVDSKSRGLSKIDPSVSTKCISLNEVNSSNQWSKEAIIDPSDISTIEVNKKSKNRSLLDITLNKSDTAIGDKLSLNVKKQFLSSLTKPKDNTNSTDLTTDKVISNKKSSKSDSYENDTVLSKKYRKISTTDRLKFFSNIPRNLESSEAYDENLNDMNVKGTVNVPKRKSLLYKDKLPLKEHSNENISPVKKLKYSNKQFNKNIITSKYFTNLPPLNETSKKPTKITSFKSGTGTVMKIRTNQTKMATGRDKSGKVKKSDSIKNLTELLLSEKLSSDGTVLTESNESSNTNSPSKTAVEGLESPLNYYFKHTKHRDLLFPSIPDFDYENISKVSSDDEFQQFLSGSDDIIENKKMESNKLIDSDKRNDAIANYEDLISKQDGDKLKDLKILSIHDTLSSNDSPSSSMISFDKKIKEHSSVSCRQSGMIEKQSNKSLNITAETNIHHNSSEMSDSLILLKDDDKCLKWLKDSQLTKYNVINQNNMKNVSQKNDDISLKSQVTNIMKKFTNPVMNLITKKSEGDNIDSVVSDSKKRKISTQNNSYDEILKRYDIDVNLARSPSSDPLSLKSDSLASNNSIFGSLKDSDMSGEQQKMSDIVSPVPPESMFSMSSSTSMECDNRLNNSRKMDGSSPINRWAILSNQSPPDFQPDDFYD